MALPNGSKNIFAICSQLILAVEIGRANLENLSAIIPHADFQWWPSVAGLEYHWPRFQKDQQLGRGEASVNASRDVHYGCMTGIHEAVCTYHSPCSAKKYVVASLSYIRLSTQFPASVV